jgi:acetyl-CoA carboxylase carboxyltransferase component
MADQIDTLRTMRERGLAGGGPRRVDEQRARGKMLARERLALLLDEHSFQEIGALATHTCNDFGMADQRYPGDGIVCGFGKINGRRVAVFAHDFTVLGGSFSHVQSQKICRIQDLAIESGIPVIGLFDAGGARIQEGVDALGGYADIFMENVLASGVIPQISVIMGPCAGGAVYSPALTDFVIMTRRTSFMFITGPDVIHAVTGEVVTGQELGGEAVHNTRSGVAHFVADDEHQALELVKLLLGYLPQNNTDDPPQLTPHDHADRMEESLNHVVPVSDKEAYDMHDVIEPVLDRDSFLEVHALYARNAIVGFGRIDGYPVGIVANQPAYLAGALDIDSSDKIARFVRICNAFNVPIVTFVDTPGYLPGVDQEHYGIIRHGAKVIYAYCEATVPKISLVTRKAIGGAYLAMSSKQMRTDMAFAWPTAQIAVMGADGAARVLKRRELQAASDPAAVAAAFTDEYRERFLNPYMAADTGQIDEVIEPRETRPRLVRALEILRTKVQQNPAKKHGIMPM